MTMARTTCLAFTLLSGAALLIGCEDYFTVAGDDTGNVADTFSLTFAGTGVGGACAPAPATGCRDGLDCVAGKCAPTAQTAADGKCLLTAECKAGLHCGWIGFCVPSGTGAVGSECSSASSCAAGLFCNLLGLSGTCQPGAASGGDLGAACAKTAECLAGLACSPAQKKCIPGSLTLNPDLYSGVECDDDAEAGQPFQGILSVPTASSNADFYRIPFPNDIRRKGGFVDMSAHPHPGLGVIGFDSVQRIVDAIDGEMTGFGLTTGIYLRFNRALDQASLTVAGPTASVRLVNLLTGADGPPISAVFNAKRNKYICKNWLYVHTRWSDLLEPNTPYAVIVTDDVKVAASEKPGQIAVKSADLAVLLNDAPPADPAAKAAWDTYAKLRDFLKKGAPTASKVVAATVFTTWEPRTWTQQLADVALTKALPPQIDGTPVLCGAGVKSPCATPNWPTDPKAGIDPRACPAAAATHYEFHARIKIPKYQTGDRPYLTAGGSIKLDGGKPGIEGYESVCMAITIPKQTMPATGFPLIVLAHGTGGNFRGSAQAFAASLAALKADNGGSQPTATIGIDQPMHFDRRGAGVDTDPGPLFYNFSNPPAARGNFYQGAADNFSLFRWAAGFSGTLPGINGTVKFDKANLMYFGHSQGGTTGPIFAPYQPGLKGAIFSGCGGSLVFGLLGKKLPYDASVGLKIALQEANIDEMHPILNLLQYYFEASDPLLYAPLFYVKPPIAPMHMLHTYGLNDNFCPVATSRIFAAATKGNLGVQTPPPPWLDKMEDLGMVAKALPLSNNATFNGKTVTGVTVEALNDAANTADKLPYDGHFVAFNDKTLNHELLQFVATLIKGAPVVVK